MSLKNIFDILLKAKNKYPAFAKRLNEAQALTQWDKAVGPGIAKHSRALKVQDGTLLVEVDHPIWKSELHHRKKQIIDVLNADFNINENPAPIIDIVFIDCKK